MPVVNIQGEVKASDIVFSYCVTLHRNPGLGFFLFIVSTGLTIEYLITGGTNDPDAVIVENIFYRIGIALFLSSLAIAVTFISYFMARSISYMSEFIIEPDGLRVCTDKINISIRWSAIIWTHRFSRHFVVMVNYLHIYVIPARWFENRGEFEAFCRAAMDRIENNESSASN